MNEADENPALVSNLLKQLREMGLPAVPTERVSAFLEDAGHRLKFNSLVPVESWHCEVDFGAESGQPTWYAKAIYWVADDEWEFTEIARQGED